MHLIQYSTIIEINKITSSTQTTIIEIYITGYD